MLSVTWGMRLVERPVVPRVLLLLFAIWLFLLVPVRCPQGHPTWRYISSEVVIPRKEAYHSKGIQAQRRLSYSLRFRGQRHIIHLRRKTLIWPRHLLLTTQDDQGALQMDYPFFPEDCYYSGYLEGIPESMVTVDTCYGGLSGVMMLDDLAYEIKPLNDSQRFEHVVSQIVAESDVTGPMDAWKHLSHNTGPPFSKMESADGTPRISSKNYATHPAAIKGHFAMAHTLYDNISSSNSGNFNIVVAYLFKLISLTDTFMTKIHVRYYVFLMTVYTAGDPFIHDFSESGDARRYYYRTFYSNFFPDASTSVDVDKPSDDDFVPTERSLCTPSALSFVGQHKRHYIGLSVFITNRIGRLLGLKYDDENYCVCQRRATCIMYKKPEITDAFSNCSFLDISEIVNTPELMPCLYYDRHVYYNITHTYRYCGNFKVDEGEQCDCGSHKACYEDLCCGSDCKLTPGSICDKELCCANCTFSPSGVLCRPIQNICDLPEYCKGNNYLCPDDTYLQDGTPCSEVGYCYQGNCTDRDVQCKHIFGVSATDANPTCYDINKEKFRFGHCTRLPESLTFNACSEENKLCGRLQCTNVTNLPFLQEHVSFHQSVISGFTCFGLDEHRGTETTDVGMVRPGSLCSTTKFCNQGACSGSLSQLNYDCTPEKCNFKGLCNNHRHCHCHLGWKPPNCKEEGPSGSTESGSPPVRRRTISQSQEPVVFLRMLLGRVYLLLVSLLFGIATRMRVIKVYTVGELQAALRSGPGRRPM
ncbi:disintegrin and metalloproteinase domain-containing protein 29-like [Arvicanthis niloticus]|uniref:disintegrin and metalloproteinase domain-containing protein 29-like n=1 Tax=Arvicanthis niloticus TaxID=61156 RepID=UPI00148759BA|nr:disintegrin and metalloproteinase domain-containing protein 29-like [Arvicanthis niloticus]